MNSFQPCWLALLNREVKRQALVWNRPTLDSIISVRKIRNLNDTFLFVFSFTKLYWICIPGLCERGPTTCELVRNENTVGRDRIWRALYVRDAFLGSREKAGASRGVFHFRRTERREFSRDTSRGPELTSCDYLSAVLPRRRHTAPPPIIYKYIYRNAPGPLSTLRSFSVPAERFLA